MMHKEELLNDKSEHSRLEVPGGWIYLIREQKWSVNSSGTITSSRAVVSSVFVPKVN